MADRCVLLGSRLRAEMSATLESARHDWDDGYRRFLDEARDPLRTDTLYRQLQEISDELRRRLGSHFTLDELARVYVSSDAWARATVGERAPARGWERNLVIVSDAAFHLYSRGAVDFEP